ncbi:hypothetical protein Tco_1415663 [Tanacetum coccineum]
MTLHDSTLIDDEKELKEDEFVHTPDDYVPNDDETRDVDNEEYNRINEEIYDDVNVKFKDAELADERKGDKEMTGAEKVNVEHKEADQEVVSAQVQDVAQVTTTAAPATQKEKTDVPPSSSNRSVSSNYGSIFLNLDNISSVETEIISMLDVQVQHENLTPATTIPPPMPPFIPHSQQSTPILTSKTTEAKTSTPVVLESKTLSAIHIRVSDLEKEVKELRNVNHSTTLLATIKFEVPTAIKEYIGTNLGVTLQKTKIEHASKHQESQYTIKSSDKAALNEFDQKQALFETMTASKSFNNHPKKPADDNRDEDPPARPDQGLKRRKTSKDVKPSKRPKSAGSSKGTSRSQPKSTGKSAQVEEIVFEAADTDKPHNQGDGTSKQPNVEAALKKDKFKKGERPPTPNLEWYQGKSVGDKPTQNLLSDLAKVEKPHLTFNELMSTPIDFPAYAMNRLNINNLTKADLVGPVYNLLKGTCKSCVELEYNMEECYKALNDQLDWNNPEGDRCPFDLSKPLPLIESRGTSHWGPKRQSFYRYATNRVSKHDVYYTKRFLAVTTVNVNEWYGYGHLEEIEVRRADQKLYKFMEGDFS